MATKTAVKKRAVEKRTFAKTGKNKLEVENSLVNNIKARKKKGISRTKKKSTVKKKQYQKMQNKWGKEK